MGGSERSAERGGYTVYFIVSTRYRLHLIARDLQKTRALESRGLAGTWDLSPSQGLGLGWDLGLKPALRGRDWVLKLALQPGTRVPSSGLCASWRRSNDVTC